jgi:YD repeat-containing protein
LPFSVLSTGLLLPCLLLPGVVRGGGEAPATGVDSDGPTVESWVQKAARGEDPCQALRAEGDATGRPAWSAEEARQLAVSFAPSPLDEGTTHGLDRDGRVVWSSGPRGTFGARNDNAGRTLEKVDAFGNRMLFSYPTNVASPDTGSWSPTATAWCFERSRWYERSAYDVEGALVLKEVAAGPSRLEERLRRLGLDPHAPIPAVGYTEVEADGWMIVRTQNPFAYQVEHARRRDAPIAVREVYHRQLTGVLGKSLEVSARLLADRVRLTDSAGGWRDEWYDERERLVRASDAAGFLVAIEYGDDGRIGRIHIGDYLLEYTFDGRQWTSKRVLHRGTGQVMLEEVSRLRTGESFQRWEEVTSLPRVVTHASLPGQGVVAEWDETFWPDGMMVANLYVFPYALVPLGDGPIWRSMTFGMGEYLGDRLDYTEEETILHLQLDGGASGLTPHTIAVAFGRQRPAD